MWTGLDRTHCNSKQSSHYHRDSLLSLCDNDDGASLSLNVLYLIQVNAAMYVSSLSYPINTSLCLLSQWGEGVEQSVYCMYVCVCCCVVCAHWGRGWCLCCSLLMTWWACWIQNCSQQTVKQRCVCVRERESVCVWRGGWACVHALLLFVLGTSVALYISAVGHVDLLIL